MGLDRVISLRHRKRNLYQTCEARRLSDLIYSLDQETASFATDFVDAFTMASVDFQKIIFGQTVPPQYGIFFYDPKGEAVELATALRNAKIPFMIAQSRAGTTPYPPQTLTHNWSNATKLKSALTVRT